MLVLIGQPPALALDTLAVGAGKPLLGWRKIADWQAVSQVTVRAESVFTWAADPTGNLAAGSLAREGRMMGLSIAEDTVVVRGPMIERLIDGDPGTSFDPDQYPEISRGLKIFLDLGAAFSVNRIRLYPRLDQDHRLRFPQLFGVSANDGTSPPAAMYELPYEPISPLTFRAVEPNQEPVVDRFFLSRRVRYLRLDLDPVRPWEMAELEVYGDGTAPMGVFQSTPLLVRYPNPVWGRVRYEGGDLSGLPIVLQTRTGPDPNPIQYFRRVGVGDDLEPVAASAWNAIPAEDRAPVRPNPDWSSWETVTDGIVHSPGMRHYLQFRLYLPQPGTVVRRLVFEYAQPAVVQELRGEIDPRLVVPGQDTTFTLSLAVYMQPVGEGTTTGFRQLQILTSAAVSRVDKVLVDDREVSFTPQVQPGQGVTLHLGQRLVQDGTFLQVMLRAAVFRDGTRFEVRAVDRRVAEHRVDEVYQVADAGDVDPASVGGDLVVRLAGDQRRRNVLANVHPLSSLFSPNGDGVNDAWELAYDLMVVTRAARVQVAVYDLAGRRVCLVYVGEEENGRHVHPWEGRDEQGWRVAPGLYLYQLQVETDAGLAGRQGVIQVVY